MKKTISLLFALIFLVSALAACQSGASDASPSAPGATTASTSSGTQSSQAGTEPSSSTETDEPTAETAQTPSVSPSGETPKPTQSAITPSTPTPEEPLPASYTLVGTKHLPIVDNQGGIGSCTSEGVTFTQFTVAVSQYMNYYYPDIEWNPSSGDPSVTFSAKFTYNYTTGNTSMCYRVLKDHGALPMSVSVFDKWQSSDPRFFGGSIYDSLQTRSWEVAEGQLVDAMKYRLNNFEEVSSGGNLFDLSRDDLLRRIKRAVSQGNAVSITGSSSYWNYDVLSGDGEIAKAGENVAWCSRYRTSNPGDPGGHCVAIIGYDDEAVFTVNGVTMKGAFLVRNSWGNWMNEGNIWMMYDAFNTTSIYPTLNLACINSDESTLFIARNVFGAAKSNKSHNAVVTFTPTGETTAVKGTEYPVYRLSDESANVFLSYNGSGKVLAYRSKKGTDSCDFAMIPAKDLDPTLSDPNAYVFYAVNSGIKERYLYSDGNNGSAPSLSAEFEKEYNIFVLEGKTEADEEGVFTAAVVGTKEPTVKYSRGAVADNFGFIYWDKDIRVGLPKLILEANVEILNRNVLYMTLMRTDKSGATMTAVPAMMAIRHDEYALPDLGLTRKDVSFSGVVDTTKKESGWFAFGYDGLLDFEDGYTINDFSWGVSVNGKTLKVLELRLLDEDRNILFSVKPDRNAEELTRKETQYFALNNNDEQKQFVGEGTYTLVNVAENKRLSLGGLTLMTFAWDKGKPNKKSIWNFVVKYDETAKGYKIYDYKEEFVFDISKKEPADGCKVQLNKSSFTRNYQALTLELDEKGRVKLALKNAPEYVFGYKDGQFGVFTDDGSDTLRWFFRNAGEAESLLDLHQNEDTLSVTVKSPREAGALLQLKVVKDGEVVRLIDVEQSDEGVTLELALDPGTYLFTVLNDGKPVGIQVARRIS